MPYIKSDGNRRKQLQDNDVALNAGELNYQIFYFIKHSSDNCKWLHINFFIHQFLGLTPNYQKYNDLIGCLTLCYKEVKRRLNIDAKYLLAMIDSFDNEIAIYEDKKILENTDVE